MSEKIGVYLCHCGTNISQTVDVAEVARFAETLPNVAVVREYKYMCSNPGQEMIKKDIRELGLDRVVVSSCSPLLHEETFRAACDDAGLNRFLFQMSNVREQCSWVHSDRKKATEKAKKLVAAAVMRVAEHEPLEVRKVPVRNEALIIGGGIAGIEAALKIAESGKKVYLVERDSTIGGHMAKFDKTFPTLDCAACILTPKMVQVADHPNVELYTYSEVEEVSGYVGNFKVKVRKRPRYVDVVKCTACGECVEVCPIEFKNEFDENMSTRKAIFRAFPQAVPNAFLIDKKGKAPCRAECPAGVHAQGYIALIAQRRYADAFDLIMSDLPLPSVCGRVCYHPCEERCERGSFDEPVAINALKRFASDWAAENGVEPAPRKRTKEGKVAVVGGGPAGLACANELSRRGYAVTVFEASEKAGGMLRYAIPEYRLPASVLDRDIERLEKLGIEIRTSSPVDDPEALLREGFDAVFLALGAQKSSSMGIEGEDKEGVMGMLEFLRAAKEKKLTCIGWKVAVVGGGNSAMDAARTAVRLGAESVQVLYRRSRAEMPAHDWEVEEAEREGVLFNFLVSPVAVLGNGKVEKVKCVRMRLGDPDESGRRRPEPIEGSEFTLDADLVVMAIGQQTDIAAGMEKLKRSKWGTIEADPVTLETNLKGVFAGGDAVTGAATVVEAFAAGKRAAESLDRYLSGKDLREGRDKEIPVAPSPSTEGVKKEPRVREPVIPSIDRVGGFREITGTIGEEDAVREALRCLRCGGCSECMECVKKCEPEAIIHDQLEETVEIEVGTIIVATGYRLFDSSRIPQYGYGRFPDVYNGLEFERLCHAGGPTGGKILTSKGEKPEAIAILHCVGSRDENYLDYCSRVCCMYSLKFAHLAKEKTGAKVYNFYIDIRAFGKGYEEFYKRLLNEDIYFIRGKASEVTAVPEYPEEEGKLVVVCEDTLLGINRRVPVDMVILAGGMEPAEGSDELTRMLSLSCTYGGFFMEKHPKLAPVDTPTDGIFLAGACQGPKDIPDAVSQGAAAAAGALSLMDKGVFVLEPVTADRVEELCSGCKVCIGNCPYSAIEFDAEKNVSVVVKELCKGCGTCVASCPSGAAFQENFADDQIVNEIEGILLAAAKGA